MCIHRELSGMSTSQGWWGIWGLYPPLTCRGKGGDSRHLWKSKWLFRKMTGPLGDHEREVIVGDIVWDHFRIYAKAGRIAYELPYSSHPEETMRLCHFLSPFVSSWNILKQIPDITASHHYVLENTYLKDVDLFLCNHKTDFTPSKVTVIPLYTFCPIQSQVSLNVFLESWFVLIRFQIRSASGI